MHCHYLDQYFILLSNCFITSNTFPKTALAFFSDDFEPVHPEETKSRNNSSVHVKIRFTPPPKENEKPEVVVAKK